ncbi:NAD(P)-dependent oxidoreductase [Sphingobium lactosutens]|uniref:SDR family NAD(P)-dependent oxidoreductase n=1 Tax=Sphingobium lactosutens TaxID=522773 RepID=UPI0015BB3973|nr:SDR family oxidoreductase [Sphingobium lactosutens]NWK96114.1 NAD(P)-dependent oxidoreductase [Sphingobium lactosutens]
MSAPTFNDKVAIVTGGGSGIGRAACQRLGIEGARVVVADIDLPGAERTVELIAARGGQAVAVRVDIANEADNQTMFDLAERRFGGIDAVFLNAGMIQPYGPLETLETDVFDRIIAVNLRGTYLGVQQARARLRPGGSCVVTASLSGVIGFAEAPAYSVSKHGLVGLVRSSAAAFAARGARINALCPGMVLTGMTGNGGLEAIEEPDAIGDPTYRGALTAQQIAEVALFLLGRRSAGINGQAQNVDAALLSAFPPLAEML